MGKGSFTNYTHRVSNIKIFLRLRNPFREWRSWRNFVFVKMSVFIELFFYSATSVNPFIVSGWVHWHFSWVTLHIKSFLQKSRFFSFLSTFVFNSVIRRCAIREINRRHSHAVPSSLFSANYQRKNSSFSQTWNNEMKNKIRNIYVFNEVWRSTKSFPAFVIVYFISFLFYL